MTRAAQLQHAHELPGDRCRRARRRKRQDFLARERQRLMSLEQRGEMSLEEERDLKKLVSGDGSTSGRGNGSEEQPHRISQPQHVSASCTCTNCVTSTYVRRVCLPHNPMFHTRSGWYGPTFRPSWLLTCQTPVQLHVSLASLLRWAPKSTTYSHALKWNRGHRI